MLLKARARRRMLSILIAGAVVFLFLVAGASAGWFSWSSGIRCVWPIIC